MTQVTLAEHAAALGPDADPLQILDTFVDWVARDKGFELYTAQQDALTALALESNVVLATPTGTGKSTVALGAHFLAFTAGRRTAYTAPIKALVSEKFFELVRAFGAHNVGMVTGDFSINPDAPVICATAEIIANYALSDPHMRGISQVVMDEFHYYADRDRGWAWQVPLLTAKNTQFLLMSATLGDVTEIVTTLHETTGRESEVITGLTRPVPLHYRYSDKPVHEEIAELVATGLAPVYVVHFSQADATERAQALTSLSLIDKAHKAAIAERLAGFRFSAGYGATLNRLLRQGIGVHHAGMLPKYRRLVEQLAQAGLLRVICGTDTLGIGINVPIRTVLITQLVKFDGNKERRLSAREFHQIAGRAGRAGFDTAGDVVVMAPEHEILNAVAAAKAAKAAQAGKPTKKAKPAKKAAPKAGATWSNATFEKLIESPAEPLRSRMRITNSMLIALASRGETTPGELVQTTRSLIQRSHETPAQKAQLQRQALAGLRSLLGAGVLQASGESGSKLLTLQVSGRSAQAFNQPLALFAIAALELLDPESSTFELDVISVFEAVLENPRPVLIAQEKREKTRVISELKADGVEYDERMAILEEVTHPQPLAELLAAAFEEYAARVPDVAGVEPQPKSIVRDMIENAFGFKEFVAYYGLGRSEGVVLRYLSDAYRMLRAGVPHEHRTERIDELVLWLGELVRQTDSSLLEEWAALAQLAAAGGQPDWDPGIRQPGPVSNSESLLPPGSDKLSANERTLTALVRNHMFRMVIDIDTENETALVAASSPAVIDAGQASLAPSSGMHKNAWAHALDEFFAEHDYARIDQDARSPQHLKIEKTAQQWQLQQTVLDPAGHHDWVISATLDLALTDELGEPAITVHSFAQLG